MLVEELGRSDLGDRELLAVPLRPRHDRRFTSVAITPDDPIYVIFTSGSTGRPKGVVVPYRGILNRFAWMDHYFGTEDVVVLQTTRHVYDSAVWQLLWPLTHGGRTVVPPRRFGFVAAAVANLIARERITITDFVPSVFNAIVPDLATDPELRRKLGSLRSIVVGGEAITPATTYAFMDVFPHVQVTNLYGPTECSIGSVYHQVDRREAGRIPIGRPISNTHAVILDRELESVPVGCVGELYLGGACVGSGYLGDPARTAAVFVPSPHPELGERLYRTGDLARYTPTGAIDFLGRGDDQIKVRGLRIELGDVIAAVAAYPGVRECVVLVREDRPGRPMLVAYVVPERGVTLDKTALATFATERLPRFMVPTAYVFLPKLPVTAGGKLDRTALPAPDAQIFAHAEYVEPRSDDERRLAEIWCQLLGCTRVGAFDDFFALGAHSLLAARLVWEIQRTFDVTLPLAHVFRSLRLVDLASAIAQARRRGDAEPILRPGGRTTAHATPAQRAFWGMTRDDPTNPFVHFDGVLCQTQLAPDAAPAPSFEVVDIAGDDLDHRRDELAARTAAGLDLSRGACIATALVRISPERHVLLIVIHHIGFDAACERMLVTELAETYAALCAGRSEPELRRAQPPLQFIDHADRLAQRSASSAGHADREYWNRQLSATPALRLPVDFPRTAVDARRDAAPHGFACFPTLAATAAIATADRARLLELAQRERATMYIVLFAAFAAYLRRISGQDDVSVQSTYSQRHDPLTERIPGLFGNPLVMRIDAPGDSDIRELVARTRDVVLSAFEHGTASVLDIASHSIRRINFSYIPANHQQPQLPSFGPQLSVAHVPFGSATPKVPFDLHLWLMDRPSGIALRLLANEQLFRQHTVDQLVQGYAELLSEWARYAARS